VKPTSFLGQNFLGPDRFCDLSDSRGIIAVESCLSVYSLLYPAWTQLTNFWHRRLSFLLKNKKVPPIQIELALGCQDLGWEFRSCLRGAIPPDCKQWVVPSRGSWTAAKTLAMPMTNSGHRAGVNKCSAALRQMPSEQTPRWGTVVAGMFKVHSYLCTAFSMHFPDCDFISNMTWQTEQVEIADPLFRDVMKWYHLLVWLP